MSGKYRTIKGYFMVQIYSFNLKNANDSVNAIEIELENTYKYSSMSQYFAHMGRLKLELNT